MTTSTTLDLKFFFAHCQKIDTTESFIAFFFSAEKLGQLLSFIVEVKPSPDRKMIKLLKFVNLYSPLRHSR